jgi:hypothetical protein
MYQILLATITMFGVLEHFLMLVYDLLVSLLCRICCLLPPAVFGVRQHCHIQTFLQDLLSLLLHHMCQEKVPVLKIWMASIYQYLLGLFKIEDKVFNLTGNHQSCK